MLNSISPFEASRMDTSTSDCQWLMDCYLQYGRRHRRRRGGGDSTVSGPAIQPAGTGEFNVDASAIEFNIDANAAEINVDEN